MTQIRNFVFNTFMVNTWVIYDDSLECTIVDPGCYEEREKQELKEFIEDKGLKPVRLINTHCHIDHILGNAFVA
ncbi:MAG: MBL fold metallo-hydrolase, partial [Bacteroidota bacterium]|nr:MBL fold metallo-hydrolase [Bacteroidota bacterium]